jgi:hypothetical protein
MATAADRASLIGIGFASLVIVLPTAALTQGDRQTFLNLYSGLLTQTIVVPVFECDNAVQLPNFRIGEGTDTEQLTRIGSGEVIVTVSATGVACLVTGVYSSAAEAMSVTYTAASTKKQLREGVLGYALEDINGLGYNYNGN